MQTQLTFHLEIRNAHVIQINSLFGIVSFELWIDGNLFSIETTLITAASDNDDDGGGIPLAA